MSTKETVYDGLKVSIDDYLGEIGPDFCDITAAQVLSLTPEQFENYIREVAGDPIPYEVITGVRTYVVDSEDDVGRAMIQGTYDKSIDYFDVLIGNRKISVRMK